MAKVLSLESSLSVTLEKLLDTVSPIPFDESEVRLALESVKTRYKKGSDLRFGHPRVANTPAELERFYQGGLLFLFSQSQLESGFLFVKLSAGKSLFGRQKAVYASYLESELGSGEWVAGPVFKMWAIAVTSLGNLYRGNGFE